MLKKLIFLFFAAALLQSCDTGPTQKTLKLAHGLDTNHPVHIAMLDMAKKLKEKSGGKLELEIYPSGQLGTERQCLELIQIGSLAMTKVSAATMENFAPNLQVLSLPYIFADREHSYRFQDSEEGKALLLESEQYRLRGLAYFDAGFRSFYMIEGQIESPADLAGKKVRVMESPSSMKLVRDLGGSPTPISYGELYTALQQGIVDGAENNAPSFYTARHYEVCKYYSIDEHSAVPDILVISTDTWSRLSDEEKRWVQEASNETVILERKLWQESEKFCLDEVQKAGVKVVYPDKSPFVEKTKGYREIYKKEKPEMYKIIQQIEALK